jgi:hypothetical protein
MEIPRNLPVPKALAELASGLARYWGRWAYCRSSDCIWGLELIIAVADS